MAIGTSGRVVIDLDPALKRRLHAALRQEGRSLRNWFIERCCQYLQERSQPRLFPSESLAAAPGQEEAGR